MRKVTIALGAFVLAAFSANVLAAEQQGASQASTEQANERLKVFQSPTPPPPAPPWKTDADKSQRPASSMTAPQPVGGFSGKAETGRAPAR